MKFTEEIPVRPKYDVIVAGAGVAGIAAALSAKRSGKSVLLLEKTLHLGGLATTGLINMFVPMCNGRGVQIIKGMCDELMEESIRYGYDTIPEIWKDVDENGVIKSYDGKRCDRYATTFSPAVFALTLTEMLEAECIDLLLDSIVSDVVMNGNRCEGLIVQTKGGRYYYPTDFVVDTTGDADVLERAGIPTVLGKNYFTYVGYRTDMRSIKKAVQNNDIHYATYHTHGGTISLYGTNQPADVPTWAGVTSEDVTDYIIRNQRVMLDKLKDEDRFSRDITVLPSMPQFRTTRHIDGEYTFKEEDIYKHFDDSIGAICDFDHPDALFEVPLRCMYNRKCENIITAGRSAAAEGYGWDSLRVIPPAIITGQAAGEVAAMATDDGKAIWDVNINELQSRLEKANVMIHFDDALVPDENTDMTDNVNHDIGHI